MNKKILVAVPLALVLTAGLAGCEGKTVEVEKIVEKEVEKVVEVEKNYVDVTALGGTIKDQTYDHEKIVKGENVTVVAPQKKGLESFVGWYKGETQVSTDATYTFKADENTVLTARYDGNNTSVWDGEYPEEAPAGFVEDETTRTWHITSASALAYWASLVTVSAEGTNQNKNKYSTLSWVDFAQAESQGKSFDDCYKIASHPENTWTLSLECNVDLDGQEWTPINVLQWDLNGFTFDGNGHTISNLFTRTQPNMPGTDSTSGGFFGYVLKDDVTFRNVTFDHAVVTESEDGARVQNMAVVIGYVAPNTHWHTYGAPQSITFDHVNITNSTVGSDKAYKIGLYVGRSGAFVEMNASGVGLLEAGAAVPDAVNYTFRNCIATNSTLKARKILGGFVGYAAHMMDGDIELGGRLSISTPQSQMHNITAISYDKESRDGLYNFGTVCSGDYAIQNEDSSWAYGSGKYTENLSKHYQSNITLIDLHTGAALVADTANKLDTVLNAKAEEAYKNTAIMVIADIDMTAIAEGEMFEWEANSEQIVYLVNGAKVTGLDLGDNVRYISGERDDDGNLIVTDKDGNAIGIWKITEGVGAYQANNAEGGDETVE